MDNVKFQELLQEINPNGYKYQKNNKKDVKLKNLSLKDWKLKSERYIQETVYDIGKGRFVSVKTLKKDIERII